MCVVLWQHCLGFAFSPVLARLGVSDGVPDGTAVVRHIVSMSPELRERVCQGVTVTELQLQVISSSPFTLREVLWDQCLS